MAAPYRCRCCLQSSLPACYYEQTVIASMCVLTENTRLLYGDCHRMPGPKVVAVLLAELWMVLMTCSAAPVGPSTSSPQVPDIPAMKRLLPRATAVEALSRLIPDGKLSAQVVEYWVRKRQQEGGPLLPRLWFEQPWKVQTRVLDVAAVAKLVSALQGPLCAVLYAQSGAFACGRSRLAFRGMCCCVLVGRF